MSKTNFRDTDEADIEAARQRHDAEWKIGPPRLAPLIVIDGTGKRPEPDPRDPRSGGEGVFHLHNCWKCASGQRPCVNGDPHRCEYPHARND